MDYTTMSLGDLRKLHAETVEAARALKASATTPAQLAELRALNAKAEEIKAVVMSAEEPVAEPTDLPEPAPVVEVVDEVVEVVEAEPATDVTAIVEDASRQLVAASVGQIRLIETAPVAPARTRGVMVAAAGIDGTASGTELSDADLGRAFLRTVDSLKGGNGAGQQRVRVANVDVLDRTVWTDEVVSGKNSASRNSEIIKRAQQLERPRVAAVRTAAPCGVPTVIRDMPTCVGEPASALLDRITNVPTIGTCEVTYNLPPDSAALAAGVVLWTDAMQTAIDPADPASWKPCVTPTCPTTATAQVVAIPVCYKPEKCYDMGNPEAVANDLRALRKIQRDMENAYMLALIDSMSRKIVHDASGGYGAIRELAGLIAAVKGYNASIGQNPDDLALVVDAGIIDLLGYSVLTSGSLASATANVREILAGVGVEMFEVANPTSNPWAAFGAALPAVGASGVLPPVPTTFNLRLVDLGGWFRFSPGEVPFGIVNDLDAMRQNRVPYFGETFFGAGYNGCATQMSFEVTVCLADKHQDAIDLACNALPLTV